MAAFKRSQCFILSLAVVFLVVLSQSAWSDEEKPSATALKTVSTDNEGVARSPDEINGRHLIVYYFHGNNRCRTCIRIEQLTREAVSEFFDHEIKSGRMEMKVINVDEPENRHYAEEYRLFTKSVVVSDIQDGKQRQWKNLQKVWELVRDDQAFKEYIRDEIKQYLS